MFRYVCCLAVLAVFQSSTGHLINDDTNADKTLVMAFVINRHGERTPDDDELSLATMEVQDIILNLTYLEGPEALTAAGRRRSYQLGKFLRQRYGAQGLKLVGSLYTPQDIVVRTTDKDRTKMTAQVAMAAMYPPDPEQQWDDGLGRVWQPIPYNSVPLDYDYLRYYSNCKRFKKLMKDAKKDALNREFQEFADLYPMLKTRTGKDFSEDPILFQSFLDLLRSQASMRISIPKWTKEIYSRIEDAAQKAYRIYSRNAEMVKIGGGVLLNNFLTAAECIKQGKKSSVKKLNIFSSHDFNVGVLMDVTKTESRPKIPDYGAVFALELYKSKVDDDYYVLPVHLEQPGGAGPEVLHIVGCDSDSFCELSKFKSLTKDNLLTEKEYCKICDLRSKFCQGGK